MNHELRKFIIYSIILTGIIALAGLLAFKTFLASYYLPVFPFLLIFICIINIVVYTILVISTGRIKIKFETAYLISFFIKFLGYIIFMMIYVKTHRENAIIFVAGLFFLYIVYTFFEIKSILSFLKRSTGNYKKSK
jgi:hypothetical protein